MSASEPNPQQPTPPPVPPVPGVPTPDQTAQYELRHAAEKRINAKRGFVRYLGIWLVVSIMLTVIWFFSGRGYFWPVWAIAGMGFAALWIGLGAYGPRSGPASESQIQDEMRRMQQ